MGKKSTKSAQKARKYDKRGKREGKQRLQNTGLIVSATRVHMCLTKRVCRPRPGYVVERAASVFMATILQYTITEILELAGNAINKAEPNIIECPHLYSAITCDTELFATFLHLDLASLQASNDMDLNDLLSSFENIEVDVEGKEDANEWDSDDDSTHTRNGLSGVQPMFATMDLDGTTTSSLDTVMDDLHTDQDQVTPIFPRTRSHGPYLMLALPSSPVVPEEEEEL